MCNHSNLFCLDSQCFYRTVGDLLQWEPRDNGLIYNGLPADFSTVMISKYSPGSISDLQALYGPEIHFMDNAEANAKLAIGQMAYVPEVYPINLTFKQVSRAAVILLQMQHRITCKTSEEWVNYFYDPDSEYYIGLPKPTSEDSPLWAEHFFGASKASGIVGRYATTVKGNARKELQRLMKMDNEDILGEAPNGKLKALLIKVLKTGVVSSDDVVDSELQLKGQTLKDADKSAMAQFLTQFTTYHGHVNIMYFIETLCKEIFGDVPKFTGELNEGMKIFLRFVCLTNFDYSGITFEAVQKFPKATETAFRSRVIGQGAIGSEDYTTKTITKTFAGGSSRVFGMLLEKHTKSNEARILLTPGMS